MFASADDGALVFHRTRRLTTLDVREVLATVEPLVARHLATRRERADADGRAAEDDATHAAPGVGGGADRGLQWAALMARTFGLDVLACPRCGGRLRLVALLDQAAVVIRILRHLGLPVEIPSPRRARAPPRVPDRPTGADWEGDPSVFAPCS